MGRNNYFQFKKFRITQEKAAMKVGIDGVLLGAWAKIDGAESVLDIGTGTGLLALMVAQRSQAQIDAVELEPEAASEAMSNFQESPWSSRLTVHRCAIQDFESSTKYSHIITNPPFFENGSKSLDSKRIQARHTDSLTLRDLLEKAKNLLAEDGRISLILPTDKEERLKELTEKMNIYMTRLCRVMPDETKKAHRIMVELSMEKSLPEIQQIAIRNSHTGEYSPEYRELTKDFYLAW